MRKQLLLSVCLFVLVGMLPASLLAQSFGDSAFESVWKRTDKPISDGRVARSWMWGPTPFTEPLYEAYAEAPGGTRMVQYFDKSRMEINNPDGDRSSQWFVTNGLLVREMADGRVQLGDASHETRSPAQEAVAGDPVANNPNCPTYASFTYLTWERAENRLGQKVTATLARGGTVGNDDAKTSYSGIEIAHYEESTGHNVPKVLWDFMNQSGLIYSGGYYTAKVVDWLFAMGYPISEPYWTRCTVGGEEKDVLVQLFERRVLTYTPSNSAGWQVEMGNVGRHYYDWRYGATSPVTPPPADTPAPTPGCEGVPNPVSGDISPRCGTKTTDFSMDIWGFASNEQVGYWVNDWYGPVAGTRSTYNIGKDGSVSGILFNPEELDLRPGLHSWVYEGTSSGHQSILYFRVEGEARPTHSCADVPAAVSGSINVNCGSRSSTFSMDIWGFAANEQIGYWINDWYGPIAGTRTTYNVGSDGRWDDLEFEPEELDLRPGLHSWVFEGTSSGHQVVVYFMVED